MSNVQTSDVMDLLAGLAPDVPLAALRRQRPEVVRHTQGSDDALFAPKDDGGLSPAERTAAALRIAVLLRDATLQEHYRARMAALDSSFQTGDRWAVMLAHIDRVTSDPGSARKGDIDNLLTAGLSPHCVVSLSQVIAYVNFQSRVLAGLRMLRDAS
jgi:uncharacterized protein YciW